MEVKKVGFYRAMPVRGIAVTPILDSRSLPRFYWYTELISGI